MADGNFKVNWLLVPPKYNGRFQPVRKMGEMFWSNLYIFEFDWWWAPYTSGDLFSLSLKSTFTSTFHPMFIIFGACCLILNRILYHFLSSYALSNYDQSERSSEQLYVIMLLLVRCSDETSFLIWEYHTGMDSSSSLWFPKGKQLRTEMRSN